MGSRKKTPSFEIPEAVRKAGQSGWVYRTGGGSRKRAADRPRKEQPVEAPAPEADRNAVADMAVPAPAATVADAPAAALESGGDDQSRESVASRLVGFGLHVAAVPFVVPLFVTAAVSRRLGITNQP